MTNFEMHGSQQVDFSIYKRPGNIDTVERNPLKRKNSIESTTSGLTSINDDLTSCAAMSETRIAQDF